MTGSLQMRLTQMQELVLAGALIAYIAFTPGFQMVRSFLSTPIGKAIGLFAIVYVWKYVSALVALLLTINFLRCSGMREGLEMPEKEKSCPPGFLPKAGDPNKCSKKEGDAEIVVDARAPPSTEPKKAEAAKPETKTEAPLTIPKDAPVAPPSEVTPEMTETFVPNMKEPGMGGCAFSPL